MTKFRKLGRPTGHRMSMLRFQFNYKFSKSWVLPAVRTECSVFKIFFLILCLQNNGVAVGEARAHWNHRCQGKTASSFNVFCLHLCLFAVKMSSDGRRAWCWMHFGDQVTETNLPHLSSLCSFSLRLIDSGYLCLFIRGKFPKVICHFPRKLTVPADFYFGGASPDQCGVMLPSGLVCM